MNNCTPTQSGYIRYLLISLIAATTLGTIFFSSSLNNKMVNHYSPLVDATMEIKYEATTAHLWFEEVISGDRSENIDNVVKHIDQAIWYANALLQGGRNSEGIYYPIENEEVKKEIAATIELLQTFKKLTYKRYEELASSGIGSEIDQKYDQLFHKLIFQIDDIETLLQQWIHEDHNNYLIIQIFLATIILLTVCLAFFFQYRYDKGQKDHIRQISRARKEAEKNENWLKTTMNSMGDGVIITDHAGFVTYLNPVASTLTGWSITEVKNRDLTEVFNIVNEQTKEPVTNPVQMVIQKNAVVGLANHTELISKDGKRWPISDSAAPIFNKEANLIGIVLVFHEITAQREAEKEREKLEGQLRQAFKMEAIGTLAGGIAHDFNNILAAIIGYSDMAKEELPAANPAAN